MRKFMNKIELRDQSGATRAAAENEEIKREK